jgi:hypothetical protein
MQELRAWKICNAGCPRARGSSTGKLEFRISLFAYYRITGQFLIGTLKSARVYRFLLLRTSDTSSDRTRSSSRAPIECPDGTEKRALFGRRPRMSWVKLRPSSTSSSYSYSACACECRLEDVKLGTQPKSFSECNHPRRHRGKPFRKIPPSMAVNISTGAGTSNARS